MCEERRIAVVDASQRGYEALCGGEVDCTFFQNAEAALQASRTSHWDAWFVASRLPDCSGLEFYRLLKRGPQRFVPCFLVADHYDPDEELSVLGQGDLHFACKPLAASLLLGLDRRAGRRGRGKKFSSSIGFIASANGRVFRAAEVTA